MDVLLGGGVTVSVPGTRYHVLAEVQEIADGMVRVAAGTMRWWVRAADIISVVDPSNFAIMNALDNDYAE